MLFGYVFLYYGTSFILTIYYKLFYLWLDIEDDDDDDPDYYITRRSRISTRQLTRKHLTSRQHDKLEDYYLKDNYPSYKKKKKIAYSTGLEITQVRSTN